ncbi:MAG: bifunctional folylpolyglutamate synthase/dihydrofolate synthase, partial [Alicyclobacillaceae bacterium]|nr:bifunctional folylpolyglutamate synthase/dihydrofolate synthase [Alicyclobacillaceae bacterium]
MKRDDDPVEPSKDSEELWDWLEGLTRFGVRPGLERMEWMLDRLGHPERGLRFIHVAGTNGKGSTCAFLASVFRAAGYRTGMFISPPMEGERDRITVDGEAVRESELAEYAQKIRPLLEELARDTALGQVTHFEVWTLMALLH